MIANYGIEKWFKLQKYEGDEETYAELKLLGRRYRYYMELHVKALQELSVVIRHDDTGKPIWQKDYELFMGNLGFGTKLCKPRHPFTKGAVERLIRFVKENFLAGRLFSEITDLNYEAVRWCNHQNGNYHRVVDCVPDDKHSEYCLKTAPLIKETIELSYYLCPERRISFDGSVFARNK